jgi:TonB-linked SusC/RagA family outer membrane protein
MKLTKLLLVLALALVCSDALSQITLKEKKAPLEKVLADIEKQTKYVFLYDPDELKMGPITVEVKNASLPETLEKCFRGEAIVFTIVRNNVLLKKTPTGNAKPVSEIRLHGTVVDSTGQPLPGVTVFERGEKKGTETDTSGNYALTAVKGDLLRFSFVGYKDMEIVVGDQPVVDVMLEVNTATPDQVVVIGYGNSKKKDLTGAVSIIDVRDMGEVPFNTFDNALAGKAAGVDVTKSDGTPGGMVRVRIRGSSSLLGGNDPLYVIDGVPLQVRSNFIDPGIYVGSPIANMAGANGSTINSVALSASFVNGLNSLGGVNPEDIESITILKDASSTAIYGSKAANGVVIITTKTGKLNMAPQVAANYSSTLGTPYRTPKLLNASQHKTLLTEAAQNTFNADSAAGSTADPLTAAILDSTDFFGNANTNWIKQVTRTTLSNNVGLSVSGGAPASKYFSSLAYTRTPGVVDGTDYQRLSAKLNLETKVNSKLRFAANLLVGFTNQNISDGVYSQAILARPDWTPRDALGNYTNFDLQPTGFWQYSGLINPVALASATNNGKTTSLLGSFAGSYDLSNSLHFQSAVSLNMQNYNQRNYIPSYIDIFDNNIGTYVPNPGGVGSDANSRFADWFLENTLSYNKQFNEKNAGNVVIGQSYETTKYSYFNTTVAGYPNNTTLTGLSSGDSVISVGGEDPSSPQSYLLSFYARANYSYLDKYLFTFTGRADGSSKFGPDNKWGYFPSGAIAWRISRENFFKNVNWINDLKLRGSYGLTGNQNIGDQMYRTLYSPTTYAGSTALIPTQLGNPGIKWETTKEADIGLDMSLLSDRLYAAFDWYNRQTSDALLSLPVATNSAYSTLLQNAVGLRNRGFEASIGGDIIRSRNFKWTASINVTWNNSLVTKINPLANLSQIPSLSGLESGESIAAILANINYPLGNTTILQGKPLGLITGYSITGIIKTQAQLTAYNQELAYPYQTLQIGDPMYQLYEGYVNPLAILGTSAPKYFGGITQEFIYKRIGLRCYFTFSKGGHLLWAEHVATTEFYGTANAGVAMLNRYTPANTNSNKPMLDLNDPPYSPTNLDVFSSSYLKLRSLTINYHVDQTGWMKKAEIKTCAFFISATNLFTITKYPGGDPETSDDPYSVAGGFFDASNYPATRTFSLGLTCGF